VILAGEILWPRGTAAGWLELRAGAIAACGRGAAPRGAERIAGMIAPGLCDLQVNGAAGVAVTDGAAALDRIDALLLARGVTSYLATVITSDDESAARAVAELAPRCADPASPCDGIHLEGPFLSPEHPGAHPLEHVRDPSSGVPPHTFDPHVRLVTLAPERPGALELVASLHSRGIAVSLGHSDATPAQADAAAAHGAVLVTHVFNAMRPFHHRHATLPAWALADGGVRLTVIADGHHVEPTVLRLVRRAAGARALLISDCVAAAGAPPGCYRVGGIEIERVGDVVRAADGTLAGSALTLDHCLRVWMAATGAPLAQAAAAAGWRPAALAGIGGALAPGAPANLVVLDADGCVLRSMRRGAWTDAG
jgi:N-acetylglucosamine-6-phosphate deacetylase